MGLKLTVPLILVSVLGGVYYFADRNQILSIVRDDKSKTVQGDIISGKNTVIAEEAKVIDGNDNSRTVQGGITADSVDLSTNTDQSEESNNESSADSTTGDTNSSGISAQELRNFQSELQDQIEIVRKSVTVEVSDRTTSVNQTETKLVESRNALEKAQERLSTALNREKTLSSGERSRILAQSQAAIMALNSTISSESAARQGKDSELGNSITAESRARQTAITTESTSRQSAVSELVNALEIANAEIDKSRIDLELASSTSASNLQDAKAALQAIVESNAADTEKLKNETETALASIILSIETKEANVVALIETNRASLVASIETEAATRLSNDNFIQDGVDANQVNITSAIESITTITDNLSDRLDSLESEEHYIIDSGITRVSGAGSIPTSITFNKVFLEPPLVAFQLRWGYIQLHNNVLDDDRSLISDGDVSTTGFRVRGTQGVSWLDSVMWFAIGKK